MKDLKTKPKTTPECEQLMNIVEEGLQASWVFFNSQKQENARVALKKLSKKRCTKAIEYIMQISGDMTGSFAQEICGEARKCL